MFTQRNPARLAALAALLAAALAWSPPADAGTLENLERERAMVIEAALDAELTPAERLAKMATATSRLVDLERMVLRDDGLKGRNTPTVRKAFANYDLTFLFHASAENRRAILDTWLEQLGITTQSLMAAKTARR